MSERPEHVQLTIDDELETWEDWFMSLPRTPFATSTTASTDPLPPTSTSTADDRREA
jgi:hypothetical protein